MATASLQAILQKGICQLLFGYLDIIEIPAIDCVIFRLHILRMYEDTATFRNIRNDYAGILPFHLAKRLCSLDRVTGINYRISRDYRLMFSL